MRSAIAYRPAAILIPAGVAGFSKLGGVPDLPEGMSPPRGANSPMRFVAQIELEAARSAGLDWLPGAGAVYVFCSEKLHDGPEFVKVIHGPVGGTASRSAGAVAHQHVALLPARSSPSSVWLGVQDDFQATVESINPIQPLSLKSPHHQLGGYPDEIQPERLSRECARRAGEQWSLPEDPESWRLLLQIDSDPDLKLEFGDGGRLFIFVRDIDAKACDFTRTISIWQTY